MWVYSLNISNFRNLRQVSLRCSPGLNVIIGANASGKTSLLEALYYLGRARSFRTRQPRELICSEADGDAFQLVATLCDAPDGRRIPVGIRRSAQELTVRVDGATVQSLAELALQMPVLLLNPNSHRLLEDGPQQRRRFMDWGLFHADSSFMPAWRRFGTALRHRNAALRAQAGDRAVDAWDEELAAAAMILDRLREGFCEALRGALAPLIDQTLARVAVSLEYRRGWPHRADLGLVELLRAGRAQDRRCGYTRIGPQRADFVIKLDGQRVAYLSRGQQKLLAIALVLAQAELYRQHRHSPCILLIDDLPAELDQSHRTRVLLCLKKLEIQLFITAIEADLLDLTGWQDARVWQIENGQISDMV